MARKKRKYPSLARVKKIAKRNGRHAAGAPTDFEEYLIYACLIALNAIPNRRHIGTPELGFDSSYDLAAILTCYSNARLGGPKDIFYEAGRGLTSGADLLTAREDEKFAEDENDVDASLAP